MTTRGVVVLLDGAQAQEVNMAKAKPKAETPKKVNKRVIDGDWVHVVERSNRSSIEHERIKVQSALRRVASFVHSSGIGDGGGLLVTTDDWRNLFATVAAGLEATTRLETMVADDKNFTTATAEVVDDEG